MSEWARGGVGEMGHLVVTGFSGFEDVAINASGLVAERLHGQVIDGLAVRGEVLPTAFGRARARMVELGEGAGCRAVLALGVWRGADWRLERRAWGEVKSARADVHGEVWRGRTLGPDHEASLPIADLAKELGVRVSDDCGGYVCNAAYHALLGAGVRGAFLHMPRDIGARGLEASERMARALLSRLVRGIR